MILNLITTDLLKSHKEAGLRANWEKSEQETLAFSLMPQMQRAVIQEIERMQILRPVNQMVVWCFHQ